MKEELMVLAETRDSKGNICVKDYDGLMQSALRIATEFKAPEKITDNHELAVAQLNQEKLQDFAKALARRRLKVVHAEMKNFEEQTKSIEAIIKEVAKAYEEPIMAYMKENGLDEQFITYTIILKKGEDEKLKAYLDENKIKYESK